MTAEDIQRRIEEGIPDARATVEGGEQHFSALVVSESFAGMSRIERHKKIYALFPDEMASQAIHALALKTSTPEERERARPHLEIG